MESKQYNTWLYNKNNEIILEITPTYPWHFDKPAKNESFVPYEEFIKNYKALVIAKIDKKQAQEWLDIAYELMQTIRKN